MINEDEVRRYMNVIAEAYNIFQDFEGDSAAICAIVDFETIKKDFSEELDKIWDERQNTADFLEQIEDYVDHIKEMDSSLRYIKAYALCCWLDERITYMSIGKDEAGDKFSAFDLVPFDGTDKIIEIGALNTNYKETKVQLVPKFSIYKRLNLDELERETPFANRDAFSFLNRETKHINFVTWRKDTNIHNLIIPEKLLQNIGDELTVAFCPMTDTTVLDTQEEEVDYKGLTEKGIFITGIKDTRKINERFLSDWNAAVLAGADVIFFPEMLGTEELEETVKKGKYNKVVFELAYDSRKRGIAPPVLTVLPSYWKDGVNSATIVDHKGCVLGRQLKNVPYIDRKHNAIEALAVPSVKNYYVIHVADAHRIVILICAEFLKICEYSDRLFFADVGSTLVLVPSYSRGESDFVRLLPALKCYGTTIIWGNSCAETKSDRAIGGCSIAGTEAVLRFSEVANCGGKCDGVHACVFLVKLPLRLKDNKTLLFSTETITHLVS